MPGPACLDTGEDLLLVHVVVSRVHDALGMGPAILRSSNGGPENTLAAASRIAVPDQSAWAPAYELLTE